MGWFETYPKWKEISKEEYEKAQITEDPLSAKYWLNMFDYKVEPVYEKQGLLAMMDPNNHIVGYKYYKRIGKETAYYCRKEELEHLAKWLNK